MHGIYKFLEYFSISDNPATPEYSDLVATLKNFEEDMINEAKENKKGDWRDPVKTVKKLEDTVRQLFDPKNDVEQRVNAINEFQVHARNARFTTKEQASIGQALANLGMAASLGIYVAPILPVIIAAGSFALLCAVAGLAIMVHGLLTMNRQDANRGLAVTNSLTAFNSKRMESYGKFFDAPKEKTVTPDVPTMTPAFTMA